MKVSSYKSIGIQTAYDLEVNHPDHQFYLANGLLTSNSHSVAYSMLSFYQAWLKTYFAKEFWASKLQFANMNLEHRESLWRMRSQMLNEGHKFAPISVNACGDIVTIDEKGKFYWRLNTILRVGDLAAKLIRQCAPYSGPVDLAKRTTAMYKKLRDNGDVVGNNPIGKGSIVALISAGAFDDINPNRLEIALEYMEFYYNKKRWSELSSYLDSGKSISKESSLNKVDIEVLEWLEALADPIKSIAVQQKYLRFISKPYWKILKQQYSNLKPGIISAALSKLQVGSIVWAYGTVTDLKLRNTRNKKKIVVGNINEYDGEIPFVIFSDYLTDENMKLVKKLLSTNGNEIIYVAGRLATDNYKGGKQIIVSKIGLPYELYGEEEVE